MVAFPRHLPRFASLTIATSLACAGCFRMDDTILCTDGGKACILGDTDGGTGGGSGVGQPSLFEGLAVLFVVDDSGSMAGKQRRLIDAAGGLVQALEDERAARGSAGLPELHYRMAVASTSISLRYEDRRGNLVEQTTYRIVDPAQCESAYPLSDGAPYPAGALMAAPGNAAILDSAEAPFAGDAAEVLRQLQENLRLGVCGSGQEQGLLAARLALEGAPDLVPARGKLLVVFLSDEEDCSDPDRDLTLSMTTDRCTEEAARPQGGRLGPVEDYVVALSGWAAWVEASAIVSAEGQAPDLQPAVCQDPACENTCDAPNPRVDPCYCGGQSPGGRYLALAHRLGGGLGGSICERDYAGALGAAVATALRRDLLFVDPKLLGDDPSGAVLEIERDGQTVTCRGPAASMQADASQRCGASPDLEWAYDAERGAIRLCNLPGSACRIEPGDGWRLRR